MSMRSGQVLINQSKAIRWIGRLLLLIFVAVVAFLISCQPRRAENAAMVLNSIRGILFLCVRHICALLHLLRVLTTAKEG